MIEMLLAALLMTSPPQSQDENSQVRPSPAPPVRLADIEVVGRPLEALIRDFVGDVAAPNRNRNLARWDQGVCIGAAQLAHETAQYVVDRVSTIAEDLGLRSGQPGCSPNILIIASYKPDELAAEMVERRRRAFVNGSSAMHQSRAKLADFISSERPVRWWAVSTPTDSNTGERAVRIPGECAHDCERPLHMAPVIAVNAASNISSQIVDLMRSVVVIIDANQLEGVSSQQLADYVAMVSLAQIDPEASTSAYASILNVFEQPEYSASLTDWDRAYLQGLYSHRRTYKAAGANRSEVINSIRRAHSVQRQELSAQD